MSGALRMELPAGAMPSYPEFKRHLWSYADESDATPIHGPPWIFQLVFPRDDDADLRVAAYVISTARNPNGAVFEDLADEGYVILKFRDMETLYGFATALCAAWQYDVSLRSFAEQVMWVLGFRWVDG